jgi:hypothetical protein
MLYILSEEEDMYLLMMYGLVSILLMPLILEDSVKGFKLEKAKKYTLRIIAAAFCVLYVILTNEAYYKMNFSMEQAKAYYTVLISQIKSLDGYNEDMPVSLIGNSTDATITRFNQFDNLSNMQGIGEEDGVINVYSKQYFIENFLCFSPVWCEDRDEIMETEQFKEMPYYPNDGSIQIINGTVVVKFSEIQED